VYIGRAAALRCAKMADGIEILSGVEPRYIVLDGGPDPPFLARGGGIRCGLCHITLHTCGQLLFSIAVLRDTNLFSSLSIILLVAADWEFETVLSASLNTIFVPCYFVSMIQMISYV